MYSIDYVKKAVEYKRDKQHTFKELEETFGISSATYYDWKKKTENGHYERKTVQTRRRKIDKEALKRAVEEKPDSYLSELAEPFGCTETAVFYMLEKLKLTLKKNIYLRRKIR
jgi:transposase